MGSYFIGSGLSIRLRAVNSAQGCVDSLEGALLAEKAKGLEDARAHSAASDGDAHGLGQLAEFHSLSFEYALESGLDPLGREGLDPGDGLARPRERAGDLGF